MIHDTLAGPFKGHCQLISPIPATFTLSHVLKTMYAATINPATMDNWFNNTARPRLFQAVTAACDRIGQDFEAVVLADLEKRKNATDTELELERVSLKADKVDRLEQQNKALKEELAQLRNSSRPLPLGQEPRTPVVPLTPDMVSSPQRSTSHPQPNIETLSHSQLCVEYRALHLKYDRLRDQHVALKEAKDKAELANERWSYYSKRSDDRIAIRNVKIAKLKAALVEHDSRWAASSSTPNGPGSDAPSGRAGSAQCERAPHMQSNHIRTVAGGEPDIPALGREVTQGGLPIINEPSDHGPVLVSERCVRKRKRNGHPMMQSPAVTRIKSETGSDAVMTDERYHFMPHESIDFDAPEIRVATPKKTRHQLVIAHDEPGHDTCLRTPGNQSVPRPPQKNTVLQPLSANCRTLKSPLMPSKPSLAQPALGPSQSLPRGIEMLLEDGEGERPVSPSVEKRDTTGRLQLLLNTVAPQRGLPATVQAGAGSMPRTPLALPQKTALPFAKAARKSQQSVGPKLPKAPATTRSSVIRPMATGTTQKPERAAGASTLRDRPLESLGLSDFKVNPTWNAGLDFVFADVVRKRDERMMMRGIVTDAIRNQARLLLPDTGASDYHSLLERFLGEECHRLGSMSRAEKDKLWIEAKARDLADKHGRQRQRYGRRPSPPGAWNPDFPTTQEDEADREKMRKTERDMIEDRRREALRCGRWLFKDECTNDGTNA